MSIYHLSLKTVSRAAGQSIVASAAYRNGKVMYDEITGEKKDYSRKSRIHSSMVLCPDDAPVWAKDSSKLWNEVEKKEYNKTTGKPRGKARLGYEIEVGLQRELTPEQNIEMTKKFVMENFVEKGHACELSFHNMEGDENPHCHILMTTREMTVDGLGKKLDQDTLMKSPYLKNTIRPNWEKVVNETFKEHGIDAEISSKSHKERGIKKAPQTHLGVKLNSVLRRGNEEEIERYDRLKEYQMILMENEILELQERKEVLQVEKQPQKTPEQPSNPVQVENHSEPMKVEKTENEASEDVSAVSDIDNTKGMKYTEKLMALTSKRDRARDAKYSFEKRMQSIDNFLGREGTLEGSLKRVHRELEELNERYKNTLKWLLPKDVRSKLEALENTIHTTEKELESFSKEKPTKLRDRAEFERKSQEQYTIIYETDREIRKLKETEGPKSKGKSKNKSKGREF